MGLSQLSQLYQAVVMDHSRHPRNRRKIDQADYQMELLNPTCGDAIQVMCKIDEEGRLSDVAFQGEGCAISIASASMMTQVMLGKTIDQAIELTHGFNQMVGGLNQDKLTLSPQSLKEALADAYFLNGVKNFPARYKCAVLSWRALEIGLKNQVVDELEEGITLRGDQEGSE